jgi:hypothetical protein
MIQENFTSKGRATQDKGLENLDSKSRRTVGISKGITTFKSNGRSTSTATHGRTTTTGAQELCTPNIIDLPIINLQDARRPFKIKVSTIRMTIAGALECFNEHIRAEFLE